MKKVFLLLTIVGLVSFTSCDSTKSTTSSLASETMDYAGMQDLFNNSPEIQGKVQDQMLNNSSLRNKATGYLTDNPESAAKVGDFMKANPGATKGKLMEYVLDNPELTKKAMDWVTSDPARLKKALKLIGM